MFYIIFYDHISQMYNRVLLWIFLNYDNDFLTDIEYYVLNMDFSKI